jgi:hypothetical protein
MARVHGSRGQIKMDPLGGTGAAAVLVADMNGWTLDLATDKADVTAFGDPNKQYVTGLPDYKGTVKGWWNKDSSPTFFGVVLGAVPAFLELIPSSLDPTFLFKGLAYIDGNINVDSNGGVSIGGNWVAAGPWTEEPPAP